jgi:hypothetical protein
MLTLQGAGLLLWCYFCASVALQLHACYRAKKFQASPNHLTIALSQIIKQNIFAGSFTRQPKARTIEA